MNGGGMAIGGHGPTRERELERRPVGTRRVAPQGGSMKQRAECATELAPLIPRGVLYPLSVPPSPVRCDSSLVYRLSPSLSLARSLYLSRIETVCHDPHRCRRPSANPRAFPAISRELINEYRCPRLIYRNWSRARRATRADWPACRGSRAHWSTAGTTCSFESARANVQRATRYAEIFLVLFGSLAVLAGLFES